MRDVAGRTPNPTVGERSSSFEARYRDTTRLVCAALLLALIVLASRIASFW